jgi:hypothetical protein
MAADIWLVYPSSGKVESCRELTRTLLKRSAASRFKAFMWITLKHNVLDSTFLAQPAFIFITAITVDYKDIRLYNIKGRYKVHDSVTGIDICFLYIADTFDHEQSLLLGIDCLVVLIMQNRLIRSDSYIKVSITGCLTEKFHMT